MGDNLNQKINCNVESCAFQNDSFCTLKEILIDNSENHEANKIKETVCKSFELDNNK